MHPHRTLVVAKKRGSQSRPSPHFRRLITWTTTWSLLDLPACTVPVGGIDAHKDAPRSLPEPFFSQQDQEHWDSCASRRPYNRVRAPLTLDGFL